MDLFQLVAKLSLDSSEYEDGIATAKNNIGGLGKMVKTGAKVLGAATIAGITAAASAVGVLAKLSLEGYSDYQQMVGGVQKLYGNMGMSLEDYAKSVGKSTSEARKEWSRLESAQNLVLENAKNAYKTAGMSANQYMETATSFSASLINSLNGDTVKAAKQTDVAMKAIADNWNTFGGDIGMIQSAYQGFAKQNYTMLDNLKLGYGGTKTEMERLIADANEYAKSIGQSSDLSINSFSDIVTAIDLIQQKQQIAGTTSREATTTIAGSFQALKAAWDNLVTGFADPDADISSLMENVIKSAGTMASNVIPAFTQALSGIGQAVNTIIPEVISNIPRLFKDTIVPMIQIGTELVGNIGKGILNAIPDLIDTFVVLVPNMLGALRDAFTSGGSDMSSAFGGIVESLIHAFDSLKGYIPMLIGLGTDMITKLGEGLVQGIPTFLQNALPMILSFTEFLRTNAGLLVDAGLNFITNLAQGIINSLPTLIEYIPQIITNIAGIINDNAPKVLMTGANIIMNLAKGIIDNIPVLVANLPQILQAIWSVFLAFNWINLGKTIITFITNGVKSLATTIPTALKDIGSKAVEWLGTMQWSTLGADIIDLILIGIESLGTMIPTALANIGNLAITTFKSINWLSVGKTAISLIVTAVTGAGRLVGSALASAGRKGMQAFRKIDWKGVGKAAITFVANALKGSAGLVLNALKTAGKNAFNAFKNINWLSLGKNIVTGVVRGITGAAGKIATAAKTAAKNALKAAKNFLGIKSPSKVFRDEVGKNIALGLALGISRNEKYVDDAVARLNQSVMGIDTADIENLGDINSDPDSMWQDVKMIDTGNTGNLDKNVVFNNYITVNGAENPEDWAMRFAERLRMEVRTA